jgi:exosortase A-associated hydrolase 1
MAGIKNTDHVEEVVQFACCEKQLYGILHLPATGEEITRIVMMVIGGPQTRIGSHRSYVQLARSLRDRGIAVFRFDYEGMGDSEGEYVGFEYAGPSIGAAVDYLHRRIPTLNQVIIWSLCNGATASAIYARQDRRRIAAMILCNPYVHTEQGQAKTILKYYYIRRLLDREFWRKVVSRRFDAGESIRSFRTLLQKAVGQKNGNNHLQPVAPAGTLPDRVVRGLCEFHKPVHVLLSTNDLTALEFQELLRTRPEFNDLLRKNVLIVRSLDGADHTFSDSRAMNLVLQQTLAALDEFERLPSRSVPAKPVAEFC